MEFKREDALSMWPKLPWKSETDLAESQDWENMVAILWSWARNCCGVRNSGQWLNKEITRKSLHDPIPVFWLSGGRFRKFSLSLPKRAFLIQKTKTNTASIAKNQTDRASFLRWIRPFKEKVQNGALNDPSLAVDYFEAVQSWVQQISVRFSLLLNRLGMLSNARHYR